MFRHFKHVMELYLIEDYRNSFSGVSGSELTDMLIAASLYEYGFDGCEEKTPEILRTDKGKPYTDVTKDGRQVHLSASHSGDCFACLLGEVPVGIDIQQERDADIDKLSRRFFTREEQQYVREHGLDGFFRLWTRKEAYAKLTGLGIQEIMKKTTVLGRKDVEFTDFKLSGDMYCSCCIMTDENAVKGEVTEGEENGQ